MGKASVNVLRGKLYLLAKLPAKDGAGDPKPQRIPLGLADTPDENKVAAKRLALLQRQIETGTFDWADWVEVSQGTSWRAAIDALYRKRVVNGRTGQSTWEVSYMGRLRQLPMSKVVTTAGIADAIAKYKRDTASYKELYFLMKDLASLIGVTFPEMPIPTYGTTYKPPDVPDEDEIVEWVKRVQAEDAEAGWAFGMLATYGLRPHELVACRFIDDRHRLEVDGDTKTGDRIVVPVLREWVELFDLRNEKRHESRAVGTDATSQWLHKWKKKMRMPFKPYALRHAFAGRLWRTGGSRLDVFLASRLMGHSPNIHQKTYRAFIRPYQIADRAEEALYGD